MIESSGTGDAEDKIPDYNFEEPVTRIKTADMISSWEKSETYLEYLGFILAIGDSIKGRKITEDVETSEACQRLLAVVTTLSEHVKQCPPAEMQSRYGNPAYRDWFDKLEDSAEQLICDVVGDKIKAKGGVTELKPYLIDSFGNKTRIDYGTGHEMAFVMFLCALFKIGVLSQSDKAAVGLKVFSSYMDLCRELQTVYRLMILYPV